MHTANGSVRVSVVMAIEERDRLRQLAEAEDRSTSQYIRLLVINHLASKKRKRTANL